MASQDILASLLQRGLPSREVQISMSESADDTNNTTTQLTHDNLNTNANLQVNDTDVSTSNPVPVRLQDQALNFDVNVDLSNATDDVLVYGNDGSTNRKICVDTSGRTTVTGAAHPPAASA